MSREQVIAKSRIRTGAEGGERIEDLFDLRKVMRAEVKPEVKPRLLPKIRGNDYCPCDSGKKFKKCCGAAVASPGA